MSLDTAASPAGTTRASSVTPLPPLPAHWRSLQRAFVHQARATPGRRALVDSTKASLTYGEALLRACVMARILSRSLGPEKYVGLMLPPTVPSAVANLALALLGRVPVNLNYTASQDLVDSSIQQCGIKHVLTAGKAIEKFGITPKAELILIEEIPSKVTPVDKAIGALLAKVTPIGLMGLFLPGLTGDNLDDVATVIFTSGSTGEPKGVVLSQRNVLTNVHQVNHQLRLLPDEVVLGVLPFFHSFGFTVTLWTVLCLGKTAVYHFNPLDARIVGDLCESHGVTMIASTPTFFRTYIKKCKKEQFAKLKHLLLGAEKLKPELGAEIKAAIGIDPLEGYGCTELSPVVAVGVPHEVTLSTGEVVPGHKPGAVGRSVPGTEMKTIDPETSEDLRPGETGMLLVRGPQVMVGYLNRPEETAKVVRDGWYVTGDLGFVDEQGFLHITDRVSRFSKVAGEMVPHLGVESAIQGAIGHNDLCLAVTALPDPKRGERLFVLYTEAMGASPEEVTKKLQDGPLPRLWIPSADAYVKVDAIPILGTGKIDLRRLKELAGQSKAT